MGKEKMLQDRCTGECCKDIGLPYSPEVLKSAYKLWLAGAPDKKPLNMSQNTHEYPVWADIWLIYPMLRYTHTDNKHPENPKEKTHAPIYHYTCIHFDKKTGNCGIYDIRPWMCSSYPNKEYCNNPKCKWKEKVEARPKKMSKKLIEKMSQTTFCDKEVPSAN